MVSALKKIGFDYCFDTTFGADLTIMEEANELVERLKHKKHLFLPVVVHPGFYIWKNSILNI